MDREELRREALFSTVDFIAHSFPMSGIYKITNQKNGLVYIGQSHDLVARTLSHSRALRNKTHPQLRDGEPHDFRFEVLKLCPKTKLNREECSAILKELVAGTVLYNKGPTHLRKRYPKQFPYAAP